jgi:RNA polymerase sigma-70 factor (ECF subfamily)
LSLDELMPAKSNDGGGMKIEIADWSALPEDQLLRAEMKQVLDRAIGELSETYRPVVLLRDVEELSTGETAQILELSEETVKQRLHRGRLALRRKLDEYLKVRGAHAAI